MSKSETAPHLIDSMLCGDDYIIFKYQNDKVGFKYIMLLWLICFWKLTHINLFKPGRMWNACF